MKLSEIISAKRAHLVRLSNQRGAAGELELISSMSDWVQRPRGRSLQHLLNELERTGISIKWSSFDAVSVPEPIDFENPIEIRRHIREIVFIEIKTANQARVRSGFQGFFFALTESEIEAAEQLGERHRVALFNKISSELLLTSVPEIIHLAKSTNWQVSIQL